MKKTALYLFLFVLGQALPAQNAKTLVIYTIKGPSGAGMIRLFETPPSVSGLKISIEALPQADIMASKILAGEVQIGVLPVNIAAKIAASGKRIQLAAVLGNGMLSLLTSDSSIRRIEDLKGKEVVCAGQGATPEFVFRRILKAKKLNTETDVTLNFSLAYPEIAASLIAGRIKTALLPEPFATMSRAGNKSLRNVADIQKEWQALSETNKTNYPMTALVVDADYAAANPAVTKAVMESIRASSEWTIAHPREAAALVEKYNLGLRADVIEKAIPVSAYVFIPAVQARPAVEGLLKVFLEVSPQSIGGKLPAESFYYRQ